MMALKTPNVLIRIDGLSGGNQLALPKAVQRHPIRGAVEHVDLIMVRRGEKVTVEVPVQVTGEAFSGGLLDQQLVQVAVEAEATNIPGASGAVAGGAARAGGWARGPAAASSPGPGGAGWWRTRRRGCCTCRRPRPPGSWRPGSARGRPRRKRGRSPRGPRSPPGRPPRPRG